MTDVLRRGGPVTSGRSAFCRRRPTRACRRESSKMRTRRACDVADRRQQLDVATGATQSTGSVASPTRPTSPSGTNPSAPRTRQRKRRRRAGTSVWLSAQRWHPRARPRGSGRSSRAAPNGRGGIAAQPSGTVLHAPHRPENQPAPPHAAAGCHYRRLRNLDKITDLRSLAGWVGLIVLRWPRPPKTARSPDPAEQAFGACHTLLASHGQVVAVLTSPAGRPAWSDRAPPSDIHGWVAVTLTSPPYGRAIHGRVEHRRGALRRFAGMCGRPDPANLAHRGCLGLIAGITAVLRGCVRPLHPAGAVVITARPQRRHGLLDLPGAIITAAATVGLQQPVQRCVAAPAGVHDSRLVPRPPCHLLSHARKAGSSGIPLHLIAHEDVLVLKPTGLRP
jgi:hypothetical protein